MFCISNSLLEKGIAGKKEALKKASQVAALKQYIDEKLVAYRTELKSNIHRMAEQAKGEALKELQDKRTDANNKKSVCEKRVDEQYTAFKADVERLASEISAAKADCDMKNAAYQNAKNVADTLERKHRAERW